MNELVVNVLRTSLGDANLDGVFNSRDFVTVFTVNEYENDVVGDSTWGDGDWNCDGEFTTSDLVFALQAGGFQAEARPVDAVNRGPSPARLNTLGELRTEVWGAALAGRPGKLPRWVP